MCWGNGRPKTFRAGLRLGVLVRVLFQLILSVLPPGSQSCALHFLRMVSGLGGLAVDIKVRSAGRFPPDRGRATFGMPLCFGRATHETGAPGGSRSALGP